MSRAGNSSRKLPARTSSTSWHSAGEALCTDTARGRLLAAATAMIFVPLPRRVGPTPSPLFSRSRRSRPQRPLLTSTCHAPADAAPVVAAPLPTCPTAPTAGICGGKSGRADSSPVARATALPCPAPTTRHSTPPSCHARDGHGCRTAAPDAAPARPSPIVLRSTPSVLPSAHAETHRASPECTNSRPQMFMRLVLDWLARQPLKINCDRQSSPLTWVSDILTKARGRSGGKVEQHLV